MTLAVRQATGARSGANLRVHNAAGIQDAGAAFIRTAAGLIQFFSKFAVSVDRLTVGAGFNSSGAATQTTRLVTASVTGAVGTVNFAWSQVSGDPMTITNPTGASTAFSASVAPGDAVSGVFKCTVSDSSGHSADTPNVSSTINNFYGPSL